MATLDVAPGWDIIPKPKDFGTAKPNLLAYDEERTTFHWEVIEKSLDGLPEGKGARGSPA